MEEGKEIFMIKLVVPFITETQLPHGDVRTPHKVLIENSIKAILHIDYEHTRSSYGAGVVLNCDNEVFGGDDFRWVRDKFGAWIETDDVDNLCNALGIPKNEHGIIGVKD